MADNQNQAGLSGYNRHTRVPETGHPVKLQGLEAARYHLTKANLMPSRKCSLVADGPI